MGCHDLKGFSGVARDHATNPRIHGPLKEFDGHSRITGPCGDTMEFWLIARNDTVVGVSFATDGCSSSLACGSIATILAQGKRIENAAAVRKQDILNALGGLPPEFEHCALLAANIAVAPEPSRFGVVENMSGFAYPHCGTRMEVFGSGGGELMARQMEVPFLGRIPIDPAIGEACDTGRPYLGDRPQSTAAESFRQVIEPIMELDNRIQTINVKSIFPQKEHPMRIAIPISGGRLAMHFGHCERFAFMDVDRADKKIIAQEEVIAPRHEPGLLPRWLADRGVKTVIVGGVGSRAQGLFAENGIEVVVGAPADSPDKLVAGYLAGTLETGANVCDH